MSDYYDYDLSGSDATVYYNSVYNKHAKFHIQETDIL